MPIPQPSLYTGPLELLDQKSVNMNAYILYSYMYFNSVWLHSDRAHNKMIKIISPHRGPIYGKQRLGKNIEDDIHKVFQEKDNGFADNALIFINTNI